MTQKHFNGEKKEKEERKRTKKKNEKYKKRKLIEIAIGIVVYVYILCKLFHIHNIIMATGSLDFNFAVIHKNEKFY